MSLAPSIDGGRVPYLCQVPDPDAALEKRFNPARRLHYLEGARHLAWMDGPAIR